MIMVGTNSLNLQLLQTMRSRHPLHIFWQRTTQKQKRSWNEICQLVTTTASISTTTTTTNSIRDRIFSFRLPLVSNEGSFYHHHQYHHRSKQPAQTKLRHYGSKTIVELEEQSLPGMELIQPYLRSALNTNNDHHDPTNAEFVVTFLGTGGGSPTRHRLGSCTALRLGGQTFLFDVTEGTLRQLEFSRIMIGSITKIFITHLHGDHVFGLVPVILGIVVSHKVAMSNPTKKVKQHHHHHHPREHSSTADLPVLEIYGPPGLYNYIVMVLSLSCSKVNYVNIRVIELVGGRNELGPPPRHLRGKGNVGGIGGGGGGMRNIFLSHYPEVDIPLITRQYLEQVSFLLLSMLPLP